MMYALFSRAFVFLAAVTVCSAQTGIDVPELRLLDTRMTQIMNTYGVAGGQMAITHRGRLVYSRGFGVADTITKELVQPTSIFRIASVSKTITSTAIMHLVETQRLSLDTIALGNNGVLHHQRFTNAVDPRMYNITIRQLLNHSSGLGFEFADDPLWKGYEIATAMGMPAPIASFDDMLEWTTKNRSLTSEPGVRAFYSNFGYTLLGRIVEHIVGMPYETYVRDSIMAPLSIYDIHAGKTLKADKYTNEVSYYDYPSAPLSPSIYTGIPNSVPAQYGGYHWEIMTPAGGWVASAQDLCRYLCAVDGHASKPDIFQASTLDTILTSSERWNGYGLGWFVSASEHSHTGGIQGTASVIVSNPALELNYAIIFNTLPEDYAPFYTAFIQLVTKEYNNISAWPTHDLFDGTVGVAEQNIALVPHIYPNPTTGMITVNGVAGEAVMVNSVGVVVWRGMLEATSHVSLAHLPSGVYSMRVAERSMMVSIVR